MSSGTRLIEATASEGDQSAPAAKIGGARSTGTARHRLTPDASLVTPCSAPLRASQDPARSPYLGRGERAFKIFPQFHPAEARPVPSGKRTPVRCVWHRAQPFHNCDIISFDDIRC